MKPSTNSPDAMLRHFGLLLIATTAVLVSASSAVGQQKRAIRANDLYRIRTASSPALAPDGRRLAYVVTQIDSAANAYYSHIWVAELDRGRPRQLTRGAVRDGAPVWSPDGSQLAFVSGRSGEGSQIYVISLSGGEPRQVTDLENGASAPVWSPDGTKLLFTSSLTSHELEGEHSSSAGAGAADTAMWGSWTAIRSWLAKNAAEGEPKVITRLNFQGERSLNPIENWSQIYLLDLETETAERLTGAPFDFRGPAFSPDGRRIAFTATIPEGIHPDFAFKSDLFVMDADGSNRIKIELPGHTIFGASWSPDGTRLAFSARDSIEVTAANNELGYVELAENGEVLGVRWLSRPLDRSIRGFEWSPDGDHIYFTAGVHGTAPIYRIGLADEMIRQVVSGERGVLGFDVAPGRLAYIITEPADPSELYTADENGDGERRLTDLNTQWLADVHVQPHQGFWYRSFDGQRVQGWVIEPVGYQPGGRHPLALEIHGGPHAMWGPGERTMWHEFQLLAANGYFVVYTNPRGSDGYGYDFKYAIQRAWGMGPMQDVLTAVDSVVKRGSVDDDRMVVLGGSYAGYLTAFLVGHDHRFKAAVAQRGVYDLAVFFGEGNAWRLIPFEFDAFPWEDPDILRAESPITYAHEIRTPLMIIHSDRDLRTGVSQSEMLYRTLRILNKPVEYVRYPREGHDLSRTGEPLLRIDRLLRMLEFFQRYVGAETPSTN